jgi:hypothetical protein
LWEVEVSWVTLFAHLLISGCQGAPLGRLRAGTVDEQGSGRSDFAWKGGEKTIMRVGDSAGHVTPSNEFFYQS